MKVNLKFIGIVLVILALVLATAGCCSSSSGSTNTGTASTGYSTPIPTQPKELVGYVGEVIESTTATDHLKWSVDQVIRGAQANSIVESGNMFNAKPDPGYEYVLYKVTVSNLGSDKYSIFSTTWKLYANGVEPALNIAVLPGNYPSLSTGSIMGGATTSGWICEVVPIGANLRVYYEPLFSYGNTQTVYIQL